MTNSKNLKENNLFSCDFCNKEFTRESSLFAHSCTKKLRWLNKDNKNSLIGFYAFTRFFELTQKKKKQLTFADFVDSRFYSDFIKFGRWINDSEVMRPNEYIDYLIKNSIKIDSWTKSKTYEKFYISFVFKESPMEALERSLLYMQSLCDSEGIELNRFFSTFSSYRLVDLIQGSRISPWIFFLSSKAEEVFCNLDASQLKLLNNLLDPKVWHIKVKKHIDEIKEIQESLKELGL